MTRKLYPTQEECEAQEAEYREKEEAKKRIQREKEEAKEARTKELDALMSEINDATTKFNAKLAEYLREYGRYTYESDGEHMEVINRLPSLTSFLRLCGW